MTLWKISAYFFSFATLICGAFTWKYSHTSSFSVLEEKIYTDSSTYLQKEEKTC